MCERRGHERFRRAVFGKIARHCVRVAKLERERLESIGAAGREHDACARRVEHAREARAEPGARAGDDGDLAVESELREWVEGHGRRLPSVLSAGGES